MTSTNESLKKRGFSKDLAKRFLALFVILAEQVEIEFYHVPFYPDDKDDVIFLLCALNGKAEYLISYDPHLLDLQEDYEVELKIRKPIPFLKEFRAKNLVFPTDEAQTN